LNALPLREKKMKGLGLSQWGIIIILSFLTALEPLSTDLYLPGFIAISETFNVSVASVQISLSTFLGGFALGQLFWGPLADRFGRKKPIFLSLLIFILASLACAHVKTIEQLWGVRFIQAIGGCGGVVISRSIITDYFKKDQTLKMFSILAMIMGIAPIIAPSLGNIILKFLSWRGLFGILAIFGALFFVLTLFFLPETNKNPVKSETNVLKGYLSILKVRKFFIYSLVAGIANGILMIYTSTGPFLILEIAGLSKDMFSLIFAINAVGLMIGSSIISFLQKYIVPKKIVKYTLFIMTLASVVMLIIISMDISKSLILSVFFIYLFTIVFSIGILFPTTTDLAITPFSGSSGTASSLFGAIQIATAFVCTLISSLMMDGTILTIGIEFFLCCVVGFVVLFAKIKN